MVDAIINFFVGLFYLGLFILAALGVMAFLGYNKLRSLSEFIREAWSNIGVVSRKQASLTNQLIDVVKGYQNSENLVMLKVSEDMSNAANIAQMHHKSGMLLSNVSGLAEKFPELKANQQYQRLIDSIQECEAHLEEARANYNSAVRTYNTARSSIPTIFYAPALGFHAAPYLEFIDNAPSTDMGTLKSFTADDNGEHLNALLGKAGNKLLQVSEKTLDAGKQLAQKAVDGGKLVADKTQEKIEELRVERLKKATVDDAENRVCSSCHGKISTTAVFCPHCGTKVIH